MFKASVFKLAFFSFVMSFNMFLNLFVRSSLYSHSNQQSVVRSA
uniref:Uncharacterized protein n=1 Tax=Anguilla anguilla TaxID=7936 RepID=A0A0E9WQW6_ANGAN